MHRKRARRIWEDLKKGSRVETCSPKKKALWRVPHVLVVVGGGAADGKASRERLCLSPYVEKPFNSKVIKSFVPELRSRKCFSCFGIPKFYVFMLWTFYVRFTYPYSYMAMLHLFSLGTSLPRFRGKSHAQAFFVGFAPKQTKESSDWLLSHPHPHNEYPYRVTWTFWNGPELIFLLHKVKCFKYCYVTVAVKLQSFICTHSNLYTCDL